VLGGLPLAGEAEEDTLQVAAVEAAATSAGGPSATTRPSDRNTTRSAIRSTSTMLWLVTSRAVPCSWQSRARPVRTRRATSGSSEAVGSSSTSSSGSCMVAFTTPIRVFWPEDSSVPMAVARWPMPKRRSPLAAWPSGWANPYSSPNMRRYSWTRRRSGRGR
jgi:hypothetical protein